MGPRLFSQGGLTVERDYFLWFENGWVPLWGHFGMMMYDMMKWLALGSGTLVWVLGLRKYRLPLWKVLLSVIAIGVIATITTKLAHYIFWNFDRFPSLYRMVMSPEAGHSIHGSMLGFILSAILLSRWLRIPLAEVGDRLSWWVLLGLMFVRIGNFWNSEIIGTQTTLPWAVGFFRTMDHGKIPRHPVQLYESAFCLVLVVIMLIMVRKGWAKRPWVLSSTVLIGYSGARFLFDFIKVTDPAWEGCVLSTGQVLSVPFFALGVYLAVKKR
jgi:prolipoprotein diacylglyceryl transferase